MLQSLYKTDHQILYRGQSESISELQRARLSNIQQHIHSPDEQIHYHLSIIKIYENKHSTKSLECRVTELSRLKPQIY